MAVRLLARSSFQLSQARCYTTQPQIVNDIEDLIVNSEEHSLLSSRDAHTGRSSVSGIVATVFGATGQLGRYVVNQLGKIGSEVIVPYRGEEHSWRHLKVMGDIGQISAIPIDIREPETLVHAMKESNVVINLLGRDTNTRNFTLDDIHVHAPETIAGIANHLGIKNFVHVSSLSATPTADSNWSRTKYLGEVAVREAFPEAIILRSGPIFGPFDRYSVPLAKIMRGWPVIPLFNPSRQVQPIYGPDLAQVIMAALTGLHVRGKTFDIGGPVVHEEGDMMNMISDLLTLKVHHMELSKDVGCQMSKLFQNYREPPFTEEFVKRQFDGSEIVKEDALSLVDLGVNPDSLRSLENIGYKYLQGFQEEKNRFIV